MNIYKNLEFEEKLHDLVYPVNGRPPEIDINTVLDRESRCELNKFLNVMEKKGIDGEGHNEGFTVLIAATTGYATDMITGEMTDTGEPVQMSAIAYKLNDDGSVEALPKYAIINYNIKASDDALGYALINKEKADNGEAGGFDIFKDAGIDPMKYRNSNNGYVHTPSDANDKIDAFFNEFTPENYPVISYGKGSIPLLTFSQEALRKISSSEAFNSIINVDFSQVIKEYSYRAYYAARYNENVILDEEKAASFSLEHVVKSDPDMVNALTNGQRSEEDMLQSTKQKVFAIAMLADEIRMQNMELFDNQKYNELMGDKDADLSDENDEDIDDELDFESLLKLMSSRYDENSGFPVYSEKKRDVVIVEGEDKKVTEISNNSSFTSHKDEEETSMAERSRRFAESSQAEEDQRPYYVPGIDERPDNIQERPYFLPKRAQTFDYLSGTQNDNPMRESSPDPENKDDTSRMLDLIEEQLKMIAKKDEIIEKKDAMLASTNETVALLTNKLANALERQTALLEKMINSERQRDDE